MGNQIVQNWIRNTNVTTSSRGCLKIKKTPKTRKSHVNSFFEYEVVGIPIARNSIQNHKNQIIFKIGQIIKWITSTAL